MAKKSTAKGSSKKIKKPAKKAVKKAVKKAARKPAAVKKAVKKTPAKKKVSGKSHKAVPVKKIKKAVKKPVVKKASAKPAKKAVKVVKKPVVVKPVTKAVSKTAKPAAKKDKVTVATQLKTSKHGKPVPAPSAAQGKAKVDPEEKLANKAQRIMKELEETMDMDKVKPRIKVPTFSGSKPKTAPPVKLPEPVNTSKVKFQLEFEFRSSKAILFSHLSDSSGLAGWFADEVRSKDDQFIFIWEGSEMHAHQTAVKDLQLVRYQWDDETDGTYFQFEIKEDDITSDIALVITDWANPGEKETNSRLWESQVQNLRQLLGSL